MVAKREAHDTNKVGVSYARKGGKKDGGKDAKWSAGPAEIARQDGSFPVFGDTRPWRFCVGGASRFEPSKRVGRRLYPCPGGPREGSVRQHLQQLSSQ